MCCDPSPSSSNPSNTTKPRIGARVDLNFTPGTPKTHLPIPIRNLLFHNPTTPSSARATHVRFVGNDDDDGDDTIVTIPQSESVLSSDDDSDNETFSFNSSEGNNDILISIQSVPLLPFIPTSLTCPPFQHALCANTLIQSNRGSHKTNLRKRSLSTVRYPLTHFSSISTSSHQTPQLRDGAERRGLPRCGGRWHHRATCVRDEERGGAC